MTTEKKICKIYDELIEHTFRGMINPNSTLRAIKFFSGIPKSYDLCFLLDGEYVNEYIMFETILCSIDSLLKWCDLPTDMENFRIHINFVNSDKKYTFNYFELMHRLDNAYSYNFIINNPKYPEYLIWKHYKPISFKISPHFEPPKPPEVKKQPFNDFIRKIKNKFVNLFHGKNVQIL
jgi:hypothetical protein